MPAALLIFLGAGLGGVSRFYLTAWVNAWQGERWLGFAAGTLTVNVLGSLLIGLCAGLWHDIEWVRSFVLIGILGGFTTFSSFSRETVTLLEAGRIGPALVMIVLSLVLSVGAAWLGLMLGRLVAA